jgi:hypothetical protein
VNPTEQIAALEARVAELADSLKIISAAPQLRAFVAEQQRAARIRQDGDLVAALVAGSPQERAEKITGLNAYRLRQIAELIQFSDLVDIARGLPLHALGDLMRATNAETRRRVIAESTPADQLPDLVRVSQPSSNQRVTIEGLDALAGGLAMIMPRGKWESLVTGDDGQDIRDHLRTGVVIVSQLTEREARDHLGQDGRVDESTWTIALVDPRDEAAALQAARDDMPITAAAARRKRAEKAAATEKTEAAEPPATELRRYQREQAARERESRVGELAEAVSRALDRKAAKKKAPK